MSLYVVNVTVCDVKVIKSVFDIFLFLRRNFLKSLKTKFTFCFILSLQWLVLESEKGRNSQDVYTERGLKGQYACNFK